MNNKHLILIFLIMAVLTLSACKSETITLTEEVSPDVSENNLNVDADGNQYAYTVERDAKTNKVVISIDSLTMEAKEALEE